ncbi:MAG: radical SAM protein, partial [Verrucomicrobiota bacterium]
QDNVNHLWDAARYGLKFDNVRGISFQPMFFSGRMPNDPVALQQLQDSRLNTADIIIGLVEQSKGKLKYADFTPLPCGDPNCATIGYLLKFGGAIRSVSDFVDFREIQGFLKDRVRYRPEDLEQCGCESEPLGDLLHKFEINEKHTFRIFIKPFMDALNWDEDRIDRCCTHVIRPDGKLDSFCRYYSNAAAS